MNRQSAGSDRVYVGLVSLGCPKNLVDSEAMLADLGAAGFIISADASVCDLLIINTCSFIGQAKAEAVRTIKEAAVNKQGNCRGLIVTGCLAQDWGAALLRRLPEVDAVVGTGETGRIREVCQRVLNGEQIVKVSKPGGSMDGVRLLTTPGHYAYVKIAEGCSTNCTYCIIPRLRGKQVSRDIGSIVAEVRQLTDLGVQEIILIAQDTGNYGVDLGLDNGLARLLEKLADMDGPRWIRLLYVNPEGVTDELASVLGSSDVFCNYIDIPVQHGSDRILERMGRGNRKQMETAVDRLRLHMNDPALRTSLLIGFPGESADDIGCVHALLESIQFDYVGMFRYSPQRGTQAAAYGQRIPPALAEQRLADIAASQQVIARRRARRWLGQRLPAVIEERRAGVITGRTWVQAPDIDPTTTITAADDDETAVLVKISSADEWGMTGTVVR